MTSPTFVVSSVDLASGWSTFWGSISGAIGGQITTLLTAIGAVLVAFAILKWLWERRKGNTGPGAHHGLLWTLGIGAVLAAPDALMPALLTIADFIANGVINFVQHI